jgi:hypothetical protein
MQKHNAERGEIYAPELAGQLRDFRGLRWGNITPTDIDAFLDFGNHLFIIIEAKFAGTELPLGQRLAIERLCDAANKSVHCLALIVSHESPAGEAIDFATARAIEYRYRGAWVRVEREATCYDFVECMRKRYVPAAP